VADIGMVSLYPEKNYLRSLPVKAFEYMACNMPMIMSNFDYWQEHFQDCAVFVDPLDPEEISLKINLLLNDSAFANKLAAAGLKTVNEKYSWEAESKKLIAFYDKIFPMGNTNNNQS
jgi:glycosyltransferase involved in cell wall biosynthesis